MGIGGGSPRDGGAGTGRPPGTPSCEDRECGVRWGTEVAAERGGEHPLKEARVCGVRRATEAEVRGRRAVHGSVRTAGWDGRGRLLVVAQGPVGVILTLSWRE